MRYKITREIHLMGFPSIITIKEGENMNDEVYQGHEVKYVSLMGSAAHTYGNALAIAQKWILDLFPDNTFKTIHVNSRIAHRQILSTPHQFLKKSKPMIIFRPRIDYDGERFMNHTLLTEKLTDVYNRGSHTDLQPFFMDGKNKMAIKYTLNRYVMYIDVVMVFSTLIQQINYIQYLKNSCRINIPFDIDCFLESYLSKDMMNIVSDISGVPMKDETGGTKEFLDYLNSNSAYPITYKLQGSTGTDEYYRYYPAKMITILSDINADDGERTGQTVSNYQISFSMKIEFWGTGFNYLFSDKIHKIPKPSIPKDGTLIPIYTDVMMYEDLNLTPGWNVYNHATCRLDCAEDHVGIGGMLNASMKESILFYRKNGLPLMDIIDVRVRRQGELLTSPHHYEIDWDNFRVNFHNKDFGFYTYNIIIIVDTLRINELIKEIFKLK